MDIDNENDFNNFSTWNLNTILTFIKENVIQILLLLLVFFIIYIVDYISHINAIIFSNPVQQMPQKSNKKKRDFNK